MIDTRPFFTYGHIVTELNNAFCFDEGGSELIAEMDPSGYSLGEYAFELQRVLRLIGTQSYNVTVDRASMALTISAPLAFTLRITTGSAANSGYALAGFTGSNISAVTTATSNVKSGFRFYPQFLIQNYTPSDHLQESALEVVNRSTSGRVELIRFGVDKFIEMNISFITNLQMDGVVIRSNPNGVSDAVQFFQYITQKQRFEFTENENVPATFEKIVCESMPGYSNGTGYRLREMVDKNLRDIYEIGLIKFRVVE